MMPFRGGLTAKSTVIDAPCVVSSRIVSRKSTKKKTERPSKAEFETRIQIVEALIVRGRARTVEDVRLGLELSGREGLSDAVLYKYMAIARRRLTEADEELRAQRREMVLQSMIGSRNDLKKALKEHNVRPTWSDLIAMERLMRDIYLTDEQPVIRKVQEPTDEDHKRNVEELDGLIVEMIDKSRAAVSELVEVDADETSQV